MLELNGQRTTVKELIAKFEHHPKGKGITKIYEQIKRNPVFLINSAVSRVLENGTVENTNPKRKSPPRGYDVQMRLTFWDDFGNNGEDEKRSELRYYKTKTPRTTGGVTTMIYSPKAIDLASGFHRIENDEELAIFMLLSPSCGSSPLFTGESSIYIYDNKVKNAEKKMEKYSEFQRVAEILAGIEDEELPFLSRGLGIAGVKEMTAIEVKSAVTVYAYENKTDFIKKYNNSLTLDFEGRIIYSLESGLFKKKDINGIHTFQWGPLSQSENKLIFQSDQNTDDPIRDFVNYIKANRDSYYNLIMSGSKEILAEQGLEDFLKLQKQPELAKDLAKLKTEKLYLSSVVDFNSAKEYIISKHPEGKQASPSNTKSFLAAVESGGLTEETVDDFLVDHIFPKEK